MKLKTLKDLTKIKLSYVEKWDNEKWKEWNTTKASKSKIVFDNDLRQEAIKWVKEDDYYEFIKLFPFKILNGREMKLLKDFAKWNFDITEEDLK